MGISSLLHEYSASSHLAFAIILCMSWAFRRSKIHGLENSKERSKNTSFSYYKATLFCCLSLSLFNLSICVFNYFWCKNGWSDEKLASQLDLVIRTFAWFTTSAYLQAEFSHSNEKNFPILLKYWWIYYLFMSCSCLVIESVSCIKHGFFLPTRFWVLDFVSIPAGLFLCYAGFLGKRFEEEETLQDPLLSGGSINDLQNLTPYANANLLSTLTFSWIGPLLSAGYKKAIDLDDVPQLAIDDSVNWVFPIFRNKLELGNSNRSFNSGSSSSNGIGTLKLSKALFLCVWREVMWAAFFSLLYTLCSYVGPYLIDTFVQYLNGDGGITNEGYVLVSIFLVAKIVESIAQRHWFFRTQKFGMKGQAAIVAMIYKKGMSLSSQSRQGRTSGEIVNFMTVDAKKIGEFSWHLIDLWLVPMQIGVALLILYKNLGLASVAALVAAVAVMAANIPFGKLETRFQGEMMGSKDRRMKATAEIIRNMRILKLQGWEMRFLSKIMDLRKEETSWLRKYLYTSAMATFVYWGAPTFVSLITFGACIPLGIPLESGKILSAIATFKILQEPIYNLPNTISMLAQTKVSLDRISSFLQLEELKLDVVEKLTKDSSEMAVKISNGNFSWDLSSANPTLRDLNLQICQGMTVAVCGTVGSGKSTLLSCILGEVPKISGTIKLSGRKAYVAQSPWIQNGTIDENILFGEEMDRERYEHVLEACSLKKDLEILAFGDKTVIGERGINLSGGQKQRIQIARALYQDADIYLFDDPFSAVDAHTGTHLFKECVLKHLGLKTVIYVTHQVEFLPSADLILVMRNGRITQAGKYNDILNSGKDFTELIGARKKSLSALDTIETACGTQVVAIENSSPGVSNFSFDMECSTLAMLKKEKERNELNDETDDIVEQKGQLVQEEEREKGKVGLSVYWKYITISYRGVLVPMILLAQILFQVLQIGSNYWMALVAPVSEDREPPVSGSVLIIVYTVLALGSSLCVLVRALLQATSAYKTATLLFKKMHSCVFRAPMSFFDATPSGRILSRASTDQSAVDVSIPFEMGLFAFSIIQLLGIIAVMSQVAWQVFVIFIPVVAICIWYQQYYIATARELSRLAGVCHAPIIQHFSDSISGSTTIRSFDQEPRFMRTNLQLIDAYCRPKFHNAGAMEWLCFRLDMLSSMIFAFSLVLVFSLPKGTIDPSIAGLAVTYGLNLNSLQAWVIWNLCNLENNMVSIERILQYMSIPSEPPLMIEVNQPAHNWPLHGEVDINNLQVRYAPHLPLVLRGLTCTFPGGTKTGIVGRTGSGKSTLIQTLFRIIDPAGGQILIDGIDITTIGLHDLRSRLSIIPQDPTMFEGTLRSNLDPLEEYTDEQIWEALDKCQLGVEIRKKPENLNSAVFENGENWSVGQQQLVCLGRVLLKRSKVLVLDEATASVDTATDSLIQRTLRQHFSDSTVITIAHRIVSVLDSNLIMLLNNGVIVEYDSPAKLLENESSKFTKLVAEYTISSSFQRKQQR